MHWAGRLVVFVLAAWGAQVNAQSPARPPAEQSAPTPADKPAQANVSQPPTADDICRGVEENAAANGLPVEFFARVIWQESRFNAQAVSPKGAQGIGQFMPRTADWRGFAAQNIEPRRICFASSCPGSSAASGRPTRSGV